MCVRLVGMVALIIILSACSAKHTGCFSTYDGLKSISSENMHWVERSNDDLQGYTKLLIPPVKVISSLSSQDTPYDIKRNAEISAYTTSVYRKMIMRRSSNYELVDVAQKDTLVLNICLSIVEVSPDQKSLDDLNSISFDDIDDEGAYLMVEVRTTDAFSNEVLVRSLQVMQDEKIIPTSEVLRFNDLRKSLDTWLSRAIFKH